MSKITLLVGVGGSGKSTYCKDRENVISSDKLRIETNLIGREHNEELFRIIIEKIKEKILKNEDVILDATSLSRKRRIYYYNLFKDFAKKRNKEVHIHLIFFLKPFNHLLRVQDERTGINKIPYSDLIKQYHSLQIGRIGVDCDSMEKYYGNNFHEFEHEFSQDMEHNSSYHKETVKEHIEMTVENAYNEKLKTIAKFHDLGKFMCKTKREDGYSSFKQHENVSAIYFFSQMEINDENIMLAEVIQQHMNAHNGISEKTIKKYQLTEEELHLIEEFRKIDEKSRAV